MNKPLHSRQRAPRREEIEAHVVEVLVRGASNKADLLVVDVGEGPVVVKDFRRKPLRTRLLGRLQIRREVRAYERLAGEGIAPELLGRIDPWALALARVEGRRLISAPDRAERGAEYVSLLRQVVNRLHRAGVFHMDLRGQENVLVDRSGGLVVVDLAGAVCLRPGGLAHRLLAPILRVPDETAYLKWKRRLTPADLTAEEVDFETRAGRWRSLWPFNRKRKAGGESGG